MAEWWSNFIRHNIAFFALLKRNAIYRKRNIIGSLLELLVPVGFMFILFGMKLALENNENFKPKTVPPYFPIRTDPKIPLTFNDYVMGMRADRTCIFTTDNKYDLNQDWKFEISNYVDTQIPFVKCDRRACQFNGEPGRQYCEYMRLGISTTGGDRAKAHASSFIDFLFSEYPQLLDIPEFQNSTDLSFVNSSFILMFENPGDIDQYVVDLDYGSDQKPKIAMAIVFEDGVDEFDYSYRLRANKTNFNTPENGGANTRAGTLTHPQTEQKFDDFRASDDACTPVPGTPNQGNFSNSCTGQYMYNGVITIQRLVNDWVHITTGSKDNGYYTAEHGVAFVSFPSKEYTEDGFYETVNPFVPLIVTLGLLYPVTAVIRGITVEKQLKQKELMKMMSVNEYHIGWSWFISFWIFHLVTSTAMAAVSNGFYPSSGFGYLWFFWILAFTSTIVFGMLIGSIFTKATTATLIGLLLYFSGYFLTLAMDFDTGDTAVLAIISLHPVAAFSYGLQEIGRLEDGGVGVNSNTWNFSNTLSGYTLAGSYRAMFIDCILWGVVTWYLNRVVPSEFGQPKPWNFIFKVSYWCPKALNLNDESDEGELGKAPDVPVEQVGEGLEQSIHEGKGISIRNLRKQFGEKTAVDNLNLTIFSGQVTALLGHNGAGKTTTISMLTGMIAPTGGYALVAGKDIRTSMSEIRQEIGICLQHDCLFPQLTVKEHVQFFCRLKGVYLKFPKAEVEDMVMQSIEDVALLEKKDTLSKALSGGMKRKLSVAIAFCGGSKTVLLDEPTSGMDPFSRRFTWNVIRQYRQDRCIILTTHFMDEADILGDRIAIMAEGQLRCAGSSLFLKKQYGVGYQLTVEKQPLKSSIIDKTAAGGADAATSNIDDKITNIVMSHVADANPLSNVGTELSFQLPLGASGGFTPMFEALDKEVDDENIVTYGVSITTLDEVFLLVARGGGHEKTELHSAKYGAEGIDFDPEKTVRSRMDLETDRLFSRHVRSLFRKRALNFKRDKKAWICSTILPAVFVLVGFIVFAIPNRQTEEVTMSLSDYNRNVPHRPPFAPRNPIPFNREGQVFTCQPGSCLQGFPGTYETETKGIDENGNVLPDLYSYCGYGYFAVERFSLNCSIHDTTDMMQSITDFGSETDGTYPVPQDGVVDITVSSQALYQSTNNFAASQYGAISFTHDMQSTAYNGRDTYGDIANSLCERNTGNWAYFQDGKCSDYAGVGFVISYNYTAYHAGLLYQSLADEAILRYGMNDTEDKYKITPKVQPLPLTQVESDLVEEEASFPTWFLLVLSFPLISGTFGVFIVAEKANKAKHLQTVAGVNPTAYWLSSYLWDVMNYQLPLWITIILMFAFGIDTFTTTERGVVGGMIVTLFLFGPASAGFTYCMTFLFDSPSLCQMVIIIFNFFIGLGGPLVQFILRVLGDPSNTNSPGLVAAADAIQWVLRFVPSFNVGNALFKLLNIRTIESLAQEPVTAWSPDVILIETIFQAVESVLYLLLAIQIDKWSGNPHIVLMWQRCIRYVTCRCCFKKKKMTGAATLAAAAIEDEDVIAENERVSNGEANDDLIVINKLTKVYDNGKLAVNNLSLGIPPGQCFGLLGINGAGKTTCMGMLTCEFPPTSGDATLAGFSVTNEPEKTRRRIGYCPQFDAHFQNMTGREHIQLYAAIKGVPKDQVENAVASKLAEVGLNEFDSNRLSQGYSGGMKRKLSVACATVGQPQIVFLDEPSTGMDPVARRDMWKVISEMVSGGNIPDEERTSVILTTHAMEECEALCPRIGIMANGKLRCLGSAQHLKDRFGQGYQVELKVQFVDDHDDDYRATVVKLAEIIGKEVKLPKIKAVEGAAGAGAQVNTEAKDDGEGDAKKEGEDQKEADAPVAVVTKDEENGDDQLVDVIEGGPQDVFLSFDEVISSLKSLTGDDSLADKVNPDDPNGYTVYKNAKTLVGASLEEIATFAVSELRMAALDAFFSEHFESFVLRERQDVKARYEVGAAGVRISSIFGKIEENKGRLKLSDYGVSQTSLEQVFNMHAAEAEKLKYGTTDG